MHATEQYLIILCYPTGTGTSAQYVGLEVMLGGQRPILYCYEAKNLEVMLGSQRPRGYVRMLKIKRLCQDANDLQVMFQGPASALPWNQDTPECNG